MHGLCTPEEAAARARLHAWVASSRRAPPLTPPKPKFDDTCVQLFPDWDAWVGFLRAAPELPALARVLEAVVRIAELVDARAPENNPGIVAAIQRAVDCHELPRTPRDRLLSLKFQAVADALTNLYARVPDGARVKGLADLATIAPVTRGGDDFLEACVQADAPLDIGIVKVSEDEMAGMTLDGIGPAIKMENIGSFLASEPSMTKMDGIGASFNNRSGVLHLATSRKYPMNALPSWKYPSPVETTAGALYCPGEFEDFWLIGEPIGAGNFSEVFHVTSVQDGTRAATKIVSKHAPDLFTTSDDGSVCREVAAFARIGHHDSVVQCLQVFETDKSVYIVMELLTGGQLLPRVADASHFGLFSESDARGFANGIAKGLAHCHRHGIAHRDVKPENILFASVDDREHVKLTDFGIAHVVDPGDAGARDMVGTPLYVAPEVLLRQPYGCAADMWSLGVIVHILLTGFPPFDDDDTKVLINKVKSGNLSFDQPEWRDVSPVATDFVQRLLCRDTGMRMTADGALAHAWLQPLRTNSEMNLDAYPPRKPSLQSVQTNLRTFAKRKSSRKDIGSSHKLSLYVSLSERNVLGGSPLGRAPAPHKVVTTARLHGGTGSHKGASPRRRPAKGGLPAPKGGRSHSTNHSEFQPDYKPTDYADTQKLHEMDLRAATAESAPASPKPGGTGASAAVVGSPAAEPASRRRIAPDGPASISATTSTPPVSGRSFRSGELVSSSQEDMDNSNILNVKNDESLMHRRQANASQDSPAGRARKLKGKWSGRSRNKSGLRQVFRSVRSEAQPRFD